MQNKSIYAMKKLKTAIFPLFVIFYLSMTLSVSCKPSWKEQRAIVDEWIGKEIVIPEELPFQIIDVPVDYDFSDAVSRL